MAEHFKNRFSFIGRVWCRTMHRRPMWPIHGEYECATCLRRYPVPWEAKGDSAGSTGITRPDTVTRTAWRHRISTLRG